MTDLEPTPRSPETPPDLDALRHHWVRPDIAARALGLQEGTVLAWIGQKKVRSSRVHVNNLVNFDDLERLLARLPVPKGKWDQDDMITKQAGQVKAAISRLTNLLTDTSQTELFHQIAAYRNPTDYIDGALWTLAGKLEAFRKELNGTYYEQGYRVHTEQPTKEDDE